MKKYILPLFILFTACNDDTTLIFKEMEFSKSNPIEFYNSTSNSYNVEDLLGIYKDCYCQLMAVTDSTYIQFQSQTTPTTKLISAETGAETIISNTNIGGNYYQFTFSITEKSYLQITNSTETYYSECIDVIPSNNVTIALNITQQNILGETNIMTAIDAKNGVYIAISAFFASKVYVSTDFENWEIKLDGATDSEAYYDVEIADDGRLLVVGNDVGGNGILKYSDDGGDTWNDTVFVGSTPSVPLTIVESTGTNVYVFAPGYGNLSTNNGTAFPLPFTLPGTPGQIFDCHITSTSRIWICGDDYIAFYDGSTWTEKTFGTSLLFTRIADTAGLTIVSTDDPEVYLSDDDGTSFNSTLIPNDLVGDIKIYNSEFLILTGNSVSTIPYAYTSADGVTFITYEELDSYRIQDMTVDGDRIFTSYESGNVGEVQLVSETHNYGQLINVKIEYYNNSDFDGILYTSASPSPTFLIRIPAYFWKETSDEEFEDDEKSNGTFTRVFNRIAEKKLLEIGYVPNYIHNKLRRILMHDNITIDGDSWIKRDEYEHENLKRYALSTSKVWLTKKDSILKNIV